MSSFYGDTTRLPMTPFQFDKIYTSEEDMEQDINNIFLNRYVLLKKENDEMIDPQDEQQKKIYVSGEVYQKQYIDNNEKFVLIASLTAPFTLTGDGGVIYDFNLDRRDDNGNIIKDYKTHNLYEDLNEDGKSANIQWLVGNSDQKYTLDIQLKEIGNSLSEIYNVLFNINTPKGELRDKLIYEEIPSSLDYSYYYYKILKRDNKYQLIVPPPSIQYYLNTVEEFNSAKINNQTIWWSNLNTGEIEIYPPQKSYTTETDLWVYSIDTSGYQTKDLDVVNGSLYGLIGYLNKLKDGNYSYDRTSLQGCIDYANQIINQMEILSNLEKISFSISEPKISNQKDNCYWENTINYIKSTNEGEQQSISLKDTFGFSTSVGLECRKHEDTDELVLQLKNQRDELILSAYDVGDTKEKISFKGYFDHSIFGFGVQDEYEFNIEGKYEYNPTRVTDNGDNIQREINLSIEDICKKINPNLNTDFSKFIQLDCVLITPIFSSDINNCNIKHYNSSNKKNIKIIYDVQFNTLIQERYFNFYFKFSGKLYYK